MFKFLKKREKLGLEKGLELGLITEEEFLRLKANRADQNLNAYIRKNNKKKK